MSRIPAPLLGISPLDSAGCNAKLRARDLLGLLSGDLSAIGSLAGDSFPTSGCKELLFTVDTILPVTRNPRNFGRIGVFHALNDLHAEGAAAEDICISYGFDTAAIEDGCAKEIIAGADRSISETGAKLSKAHSFLSTDISISVAAIGTRKSSREIVCAEKSYAVILTKPLGAAMGCFLGEIQDDKALVNASEQLMLQGHHRILDVLRNHCVHGTTDITGFGLIGHLACLAVRESLEIEINEAAVPILPALSRISNASNLRNCSAIRNREDFREYWERKNKAQDLADLLIFSGETSGPIACLVETAEKDEVLCKLIDLGFSAASEIASGKGVKNGRVIIQ
jgi:selenide, water dikinase